MSNASCISYLLSRYVHTLFYLNLRTADCNGTKITIFLVKFIYSFITIEEQLIDNNDYSDKDDL